ncbi:Metallo-dependent phosphatase-like protein [Blastocladiella britannica]|nr:Metallo-dependent phosphatase-like protein [Blastocladiella britannica]
MPPRSITILHVTDLHVDHAAPQRLAAILANRLKNNALATVSAILVGGDLLNVWHPLTDDVKYDAPATEAMRTDWAAVLFRDVAQVLRTAVGDDGTGDHRVPVLWIPGNHDPIESFDAADPDAWLTAHGVLIPPGVASVHGRSFALAPGLRVVGLGGSVPATRAGTGEQIWPGCPFSTDGELQHTIDTVIKPLIQQTDGQVLLLTHSGPSLTSKQPPRCKPIR